MRLLFFLFFLFSSMLLAEKVDSRCTAECRNKGYQYHYCEMKCLNGNTPSEKERDTSHAPLESEIDSKCMNLCIKEKKQYNVCEVKCRY